MSKFSGSSLACVMHNMKCYRQNVFVCSTMSKFVWPHGMQHTRPSHPSLSPRVCSNSYPLSQWYHLTISFSINPVFSCPQSFPASESFPMSQLFTSGGQNIGASASAPVFPINIQGWFLLRLTGLTLLSNASQEPSPGPQFKSNSSVLSLLYGPTFTSVHDYWKNHSFDYMVICPQRNVSAF